MTNLELACRNIPHSNAFAREQLIGRVAMTRTFVTKILSLAAMMTLLTVCVLVAVPKNAGGKLGSHPHATSVR